jgi:transcriptional regulator with XRE-family HTH domain
MDRRIAFGKRIRALREDRGYSQEELAEFARLHRTYIGGVERGERNVSLINIWRIADALGVNPSVLFATTADRSAQALDRRQSRASAAELTVQEDRRWTKKKMR